jgi:hypothetical protein
MTCTHRETGKWKDLRATGFFILVHEFVLCTFSEPPIYTTNENYLDPPSRPTYLSQCGSLLIHVMMEVTDAIESCYSAIIPDDYDMMLFPSLNKVSVSTYAPRLNKRMSDSGLGSSDVLTSPARESVVVCEKKDDDSTVHKPRVLLPNRTKHPTAAYAPALLALTLCPTVSLGTSSCKLSVGALGTCMDEFSTLAPCLRSFPAPCRAAGSTGASWNLSTMS